MTVTIPSKEADSVTGRPAGHLDFYGCRGSLRGAGYQSDVAGAFANLGARIFLRHFRLCHFRVADYHAALKEYGKRSTIGLREFYARRAHRILLAAIAFMMPAFVIFWPGLRWYHSAAAALYLANNVFSYLGADLLWADDHFIGG